MTAPVEPRHDAPMCKCGEGMLIPALYQQGMLKPEPPPKWPNVLPNTNLISSFDMVCSGTGARFPAKVWRAMRAWWSVGAHEQHLVDEAKAGRRLMAHPDEPGCPRAACGHPEHEHNVLTPTCGVDGCPCGDATFDSRARESRAGSDWTMSPREASLRGFGGAS